MGPLIPANRQGAEVPIQPKSPAAPQAFHYLTDKTIPGWSRHHSNGSRQEYADDAGIIPHRDLRMGIEVESTPFVDWFPFHKHPANGVERFDAHSRGRIVHCAVKMLDHCAIKIAKKAILFSRSLRTEIHGKFEVSRLLLFYKALVGALHELDIFTDRQIQTVAQINHGPNDGGLHALLSRCPILGPLACALRIGFPEICPRPKPVIFPFAMNEARLSLEQFVNDGCIAAMIAQNEGRP